MWSVSVLPQTSIRPLRLLLTRFHLSRATVATAARPAHRSCATAGASLDAVTSTSGTPSFILTGVEDSIIGFISGKSKATSVAHAVWKRVVQRGDVVIDATCGNGNDTLALLKLVADESKRGRVYGLDIQESAIDYTSKLLDLSVDDHERKLVKLFTICHSKMEDIIPKDQPTVRLVAFNLGYLPHGDKSIITTPQTTELALQSASRLVGSQGLISIVVYVGHGGGRDELEVVQSFAADLPVETWMCCKFEVLNRPTAPKLFFLYKK